MLKLNSGLLLLPLYICVLAFPVSAEPPTGKVTYNPCPYSCAMLKLDSQNCREWSEGNTCYVEDLTQLPPALPPPAPKDAPTANFSGPCPFTCNENGYAMKVCKEWKEGEKCFIGPRDNG